MNTDTAAYRQAWAEVIRSRREWLEEREGLTQAKLARDLGVTPVTVWRWEHAQGAPSPVMQAKLVRLLGIDPVTLHSIMTKASAA